MLVEKENKRRKLGAIQIQEGGDLQPSHAVTGAEDLGEGPVRYDVTLALQKHLRFPCNK